MSIEKIKEKLQEIIYPGFSKDIVTFNFVKDIKENNKKFDIILKIPSPASEVSAKLKEDISKLLSEFDLNIEIQQPEKPKEVKKESKNIVPSIKKFLMISSGKGGVGKTTSSVNIAIALAMQGKSVGLLDADIYGPNVPRMMGFLNKKPNITTNTIEPFDVYGVKAISMGSLIEGNESLIWRGAMIMKVINQLLTDVKWGDLDILVIDMPPGTGDAQLTLAQSVPVSAGVVVTTPQLVSLDDSKRSLDMFKKLKIPIAGMIENMSGFICPHCDEESDIFDKDSSLAVAKEFNTEVLANIPLDLSIRKNGDIGKPIVYFDPEHIASKKYIQTAHRLIEILDGSNTSNQEIQPTSGGKSACSK
jgi:ATP-binding protein involved in chromosome partitioning